jgi:CheY-like chemotaxis protein
MTPIVFGIYSVLLVEYGRSGGDRQDPNLEAG